jgi:hypothetical protein
MPPINWLRAVLAFITRPPSNAPTNRLTPQLADLWVEAHFGELRSQRMHGVTFMFLASLGAAFGLDKRGALAAEQLGQSNTAPRTDNRAILQAQRISRGALQTKPRLRTGIVEQLVAHRLAGCQHRRVNACDCHGAADTGAGGNAESRSSNRTRSTGRLSVSAAICDMTV